MKRQVWADGEVTQKVNADFVPVLLDVDDPVSKPVMERYNVSGSPWTFITDGDGTGTFNLPIPGLPALSGQLLKTRSDP